MTVVEAGVIGGPFLFILGMLIKFVSTAYRYPLPQVEECPQGCRLPIIIQEYWDRADYRCGSCARRYVLVSDYSLPREAHRKWALAGKRVEVRYHGAVEQDAEALLHYPGGSVAGHPTPVLVRVVA